MIWPSPAEWRRALRPLFWTITALVALTLAGSFVPYSRVAASGHPWLPAKYCSGCPMCGMTRSFCALSAGRWKEGWAWNRGGPLLWSAGWAWLAGAGLVALRRFRMRSLLIPAALGLVAGPPVPAHAAPQPVQIQLAGDWALDVSLPGSPPTRLNVPRPVVMVVTAEKHLTLPVFNPNAGGWVKGAQLRKVQAQETTTPFLLDPASLVLRAGPRSTAETYERGKDYEADLAWGTVGRLEGGRIGEGQPVWTTYPYTPLRLDTVYLTAELLVKIRPGLPRAAAPLPAPLQEGERRLAHVWIPGRVEKLAPEHLFPVLEEAYPEPPKRRPSAAEKLLPKTVRKLQAGEPLRILAWGDSVTVGTYVPDYQQNRWQEQFVARLRTAYPKAKIELVTEAWGGRNTGSYLAEPPGSEHNYREKVLGAKPDLIISEFVNDAGLNPAQVEERYGKLRADFREIGAEWILLTPHYVRPDWMGLTRERDVDDDPRPYVAGLRQFAARHDVALADASLRYGRLWRQGIPYSTLMLNSINHPDARGMKLFADALMALFP